MSARALSSSGAILAAVRARTARAPEAWLPQALAILLAAMRPRAR